MLRDTFGNYFSLSNVHGILTGIFIGPDEKVDALAANFRPVF